MKDKTMNAWQTGICLFIIIFANKILLLPSLLYDIASIEGAWAYFISFAFELGLITLFVFVKRRYNNISFAELVRKKLGVITLKIFYLLLALFFLCKLVLIYNVTYIFFKDLIYKDSGTLLFLISFLPIINYLALSSMRVIGRTMQLFFPIILLIFIFCTTTSLISVGEAPLLFQGSALNVFLATIKHISAFGDSIFLFVFMDKIEYKKGDGKKIYLMSGLAILFVLLTMFAFYFSYTYTSFMHPYAIFETMGNIKDYGGLGRIDSIAVILVIILTYLQMGLYLKAFVVSFKEVFPKLSPVYGVVTFDFLFVIIISLIVRTLEKTVFYAESVLPYFSLISFVLVPLSAITFLILKRKRSDE